MKKLMKDINAGESNNVFDIDTNTFMEKVCDAVKNRDKIFETDYVVSMDLNENIPYKLYKNNTKVYIND